MSDELVIEAMMRFGGSFVSALGQAAMYADPENLRRMKRTWPEYWERYEAMAATLSAD